MRRVSTANLQPGMVLGKTLYGENGEILLKKGAILNDNYMDSLKRRGFIAVYICDGIADDVEPKDVLSERVRESVQRHVNHVFEIVVKATDEIQTPVQVQEIGPVNYKFSDFEALHKDIENIIDEVAESETLTGIASLKSYDNYTYLHSVDVTVTGLMLGKRIFMNKDDMRQLALGCLFHDIGKTKVPLDVLNKPGKLDPPEWDQIELHPSWGYEIVKTMPMESFIPRNIALSHHERQDGKGYPRQISGLNRVKRTIQERVAIPKLSLSAEIAAVADVYSALSSDRPYRPALKSEEIVAILKGMAGTQLNEELVTRFLSMVPTFPEGIGIMVKEGRYKGCKGIVCKINKTHLDRPLIRLYYGPEDKTIDPFEVDTAKEPEIVIASIADLPLL